MLNSLQIHNFRGFREFRLNGLAPVNLLVGRNNCGKTSLLEAINLVATGGAPRSLMGIMQRGISLYLPSDQQRYETGFLFHNCEADLGAEFTIATSNKWKWSVIGRLEKRQEDLLPGINDPSDLALKISHLPTGAEWSYPIDSDGRLSRDNCITQARRESFDAGFRTVFVALESMNEHEIASRWSQIVLHPEEKDAMETIRLIEPRIERIAITVPRSLGTGGIMVKLRNLSNPVPIGLLGDGVRRLFAIAVAMAEAKGGVLLIDEIDTGLHYTVLADMWRIVVTTALQLKTQVFATTHSMDCIEALSDAMKSAGLQGPNPPVPADSVGLHRISADEIHGAVSYRGEQIQEAVQRGLEVR